MTTARRMPTVGQVADLPFAGGNAIPSPKGAGFGLSTRGRPNDYNRRQGGFAVLR
jgi:hypothetical protein